MLQRLAREEWDILVIGGGISGAGVAREASLRGLKVGLVEQNDFASGTSSRSGKMIIGGLRYLLNRDFHLVRKGIKERDWLARAAPHLCQWTPYLFPVWRGDPDSLLKIRFGLALYDLFGLGGARKTHIHFNPRSTLQIEPGLRPEGLKGSAQYWDGMTDDARLVIETLQVAASQGAGVANYAQVVSFQKDCGRISMVKVLDRLSNKNMLVRARTVLVAAGPWTDQIRKLDNPNATPLLRLVKGSFMVVPRERLPVQRNVTLRAADNRMTFAVPFGGHTYLGTTEVDHQGDPGEAAISRGEVDYLLGAAQKAFPEAALCGEDIISSWAGIRPLVGSRPGQNPSQVKRDYTISTSASGLAVLAGGKLTGFRAMAEQVINQLFPETRSATAARAPVPFPGASGRRPTEADFDRLAQLTKVPVVWLEENLARYGSSVFAVESELPQNGSGVERWIRAQARYAVRYEMAQKLVDVLWRRTGLMITSRGNALDRAGAVATEMGGLLSWSAERIRHELADYRAEVDRMWSWREARHKANRGAEESEESNLEMMRS